jgi:hypothetical protein
VNRIEHRAILCMLMIVVLVPICNVLGPLR